MAASSQSSRAMYRIATAFCALTWPLLNREGAAQSATEHPYLGLSKANNETCLTCHPDKAEGKFVHAAGKVSCASCHRSATGNGRTTMSFAGLGAGLCTNCHETMLKASSHAPAAQGECLVCHNPHSSAFGGQTRAAIRTLCMSCHFEGSPDVKVDRARQRVTLLGGRSIGLAVFDAAQKVSSRHGEEVKPVGSCISCHAPHGGSAKSSGQTGGRQ